MTGKQRDRGKQRGGVGQLLTLPLTIAGIWLAYSQLIIDHREPLPDAILADREPFLSKGAGWLSYYVDRTASGRPLVLIHAVNAAACAYEMGPIFSHYRVQRPVFALDLPGYGFSNRLKRDYTPELMASAIVDLLASQVNEPADLVALSLGCEFAARAALERPDLVRSLVMISPSGFNRPNTGRTSQLAGVSGRGDRLHTALAVPLWARALFDLVSSRRSIEFFLKQSFVGPIPPGFVDYAYATSHQPGAEHAPLHFLSGRLFTPDVARTLYAQVQQPTLVVYDQDAYVSFDGLPDLLARNNSWQAVRFAPSRGLPHFERMEDLGELMEGFWQEI